MKKIYLKIVITLLTLLFININSLFAKDIVITHKVKTNKGLFGYKYVDSEKKVKTENGNTITIYNYNCYDPGMAGCRFALNAGCGSDNLPFEDTFYNTIYDEIDAAISRGILYGNEVHQYSTQNCAGVQTIFVVTKSWDAVDEGNNTQTIQVEPIE